PSDAPTNVTVVTASITYFRVTWLGITFAFLSGYDVIYWEVNDTSSEKILRVNSTNENFADVTGLNPLTDYTVQVAAVGRDNETGPRSLSVNITTLGGL
ncbi:hypothetical protein OS493_022541, partial [Desmophyllum pertusum]